MKYGRGASLDNGGMTGLSVSDAAAKVGLTAHTLRWYEQEGLVDPVERDAAGRRRYQQADLDWLQMLIKLRSTGMPVRDMRRFAQLCRAGDSSIPDRLDLLEEHRRRVLHRIEELRADLGAVEYKIDYYRSVSS
jgi:DNA-binding transcriptional MerR regulator